MFSVWAFLIPFQIQSMPGAAMISGHGGMFNAWDIENLHAREWWQEQVCNIQFPRFYLWQDRSRRVSRAEIRGRKIVIFSPT
jgi:hypothetical protein